MEAGWHHLSLIPGIVYLIQFKLFELHVWFYRVDLRLILVEIIDLSCTAGKVKIKDEKVEIAGIRQKYLLYFILQPAHHSARTSRDSNPGVFSVLPVFPSLIWSSFFKFLNISLISYRTYFYYASFKRLFT